MAQRILLVQLEKGMDKLFLPLGLLYVADALRQKGKESEIFHRYGNNQNIDELVEKVSQEKPEWVGFSTMTAPQLIPTIEASKRLKDETNTKIVWGGIHPTVVDNVEQEPYVDEVAKGEGEEWITGNNVKNLDDFSPLWSKIDANRYGRTIHLITSRGCLYRFGFCYSPVVRKCRWKCHNVHKVLEIANSYPIEIKKVEFRDDYFLVNLQRSVEIINSLKVPWLATIRANHLTDDLVEKFEVMPESLAMGVETASERLLELVNKDIILHDVFDALDVADRHKIKLYCSLIIGLPTEKPEERQATIDMAKDLEKEYSNITCDVKPYRCYPKTPLYDLALDLGFKPPKNTEEWANYAMKVWDSD